MEVKVKYEVIARGTRKFCTVTHEIPDLKPQTVNVILNRESVTLTTTLEKEVDDYISDMDKSTLMFEKDWSLIINWEILKDIPKEKKPKNKFPSFELSTYEKVSRKLTQSELVALFIVTQSTFDESLRNDFIACYKEQFENVKDLKFNKQIDIVFKSMAIGYKSVTNAFTELNNFDAKAELEKRNKLNQNEQRVIS